MPFLFEQLHFLHFLQGLRNPVTELIFRFLNFFDTDYFICSLIAFIWIGFSWRWGVRFGYLMIASGWVNAVAKLAFNLPRPGFFDPSLALVRLSDNGFPSGGAQTSLLLACLLIYYWKGRWAWPIGIIYFMTISFSRLFLGVHFPLDVLGGWVIGSFLFVLFIKSYRQIEQIASRHSLAVSGLALAMAILLGLFFRDYKTTFLMASMAAMTIGVYFSTKFDLYLAPVSNRRNQIALGLFGVVSSVILTFFFRMLTPKPVCSLIIQAIASGIWISLLVSPFCRRVFFFKKRRPRC
jgi:membrane-associated phospholipid phosphatase